MELMVPRLSSLKGVSFKLKDIICYILILKSLQTQVYFVELCTQISQMFPMIFKPRKEYVTLDRLSVHLIWSTVVKPFRRESGNSQWLRPRIHCALSVNISAWVTKIEFNFRSLLGKELERGTPGGINYQPNWLQLVIWIWNVVGKADV